jgi:SAM-dependent methyltransferase
MTRRPDGWARPLAYDESASAYAKAAMSGPYHAFCDLPTVADLLGPVDGQRVLEAGSGPGWLAGWLAESGADVTCFDSSPAMVELTRSHVPPDVDVRHHTLPEPCSWIPDGSIDAVVSSLVIHHIEEREKVLKDFRRTLAPGGRVVLTSTHPFADWARTAGSYFDETALAVEWDIGVRCTFWRQPLDRWHDEFRRAGFFVDRLVEHRAPIGMRDEHPEAFEILENEPELIGYRLVPDSVLDSITSPDDRYEGSAAR